MGEANHELSKQRIGWGVGLALGIGIGVALGTAMGNIVLGIGIGIALGIALSAAFAAPRGKAGTTPEDVQEAEDGTGEEPNETGR